MPNSILLKNVKLAKTGSRFVLTIPAGFVKNELIQPNIEYDVEFKEKPKIAEKKPNSEVAK